MAVFGWSLDSYFEKRKMWFIDSFSMKKEKISGEVSWDIGPANLLAKECPRVITPLGTTTIVIDSLSDIIRSAPFPAIEQTQKKLQNHVRTQEGSALLLASKGIHSEHLE